MDDLFALPAEERRIYCEQAAAKLKLPPVTIEKDLWVTWTLRELFRMPKWGEQFTFKGGTSLSKGWKLIDRFSEDIDVTIDRSIFGYGGQDAPDNAPSSNQRRKRLKQLKEASVECVGRLLLPQLLEAVKRLPENIECGVQIDPNEPQTLLLEYPTIFPSQISYLREDVKIEFGAKAECEPAEPIEIISLVEEAFPGAFKPGAFKVRAEWHGHKYNLHAAFNLDLSSDLGCVISL